MLPTPISRGFIQRIAKLRCMKSLTPEKLPKVRVVSPLRELPGGYFGGLVLQDSAEGAVNVDARNGDKDKDDDVLGHALAEPRAAAREALVGIDAAHLETLVKRFAFNARLAPRVGRDGQ